MLYLDWSEIFYLAVQNANCWLCVFGFKETLILRMFISGNSAYTVPQCHLGQFHMARNGF